MSDTIRHMPSSYPAASLGLCLEKASLALDALPALGSVPRSWVTPDVLAQACGYKGFETNSAPKGLIAAMSHFSIVERSTDKKLRFKPELLSALAEESARAELIAKAFKRPKVYQTLFALFGSQTSPSRQDVTKHLTEACGFATRPAQIMASNFIDDLALRRSVDNVLSTADFVDSISTPSGTHVRIASDRELTAGDLVYVENFLRLKRDSQSNSAAR